MCQLTILATPLSQIAFGGLFAAALGKWTMKVGTRASMVCGGAMFGTGFFVSALGVTQHNLSLLYAGNRESIHLVFFTSLCTCQ